MKKTNTVLEGVEKSVSIEVAKPTDPKEYFQDRDGLYVFSSFQERIVERASSVSEGTKYALMSSKLTKYATDEQIEKELPKEHIFSESDVCAIVADLIEKQPKGEEGTLLNNGYANLFYTPNFVVSVRWIDDEWSVSTWRRDDDGWVGEVRVFSPAN